MKHAVFNGVPTYKQLEALHQKLCQDCEKLETIYDDGYYITMRFSTGKYHHLCVSKINRK